MLGMILVTNQQRYFISSRTKEALRAKKEQGVKLGRPKGTGKSKLNIEKYGRQVS
jgi:DNA invertase Pin-like site-specific DNA recombinase